MVNGHGYGSLIVGVVIAAVMLIFNYLVSAAVRSKYL